MRPDNFVLPSYDGGGLGDVLPAVASSLTDKKSTLPAARSAIVVLVDGLGLELLRARGGHAPFLRKVLAKQRDWDGITAGFPTTTATSMGSFGTALPPGAHGLVGYQVRVPGTNRLFNELSWENGPLPRTWQPHPTVFEAAAARGVNCTMVAADYFAGSGLTTAALRGTAVIGLRDLPARVDAALAAARTPKSLVYLYWGDVDKIGHEFGVDSPQWSAALEHVDAELSRLHRSLPAGTSLTITADHGMVDVPTDTRIDLAFDRELAAGVELCGGDLRAPQLYCVPGAAEDVCATWAARLADSVWVLSRADAIQQGLFGPVDDSVIDRIGDVIVAYHRPGGVFDSRVIDPKLLKLIGHHGSLTAAEMRVPLIHLPTS